jgi:hypothetical protein
MITSRHLRPFSHLGAITCVLASLAFVHPVHAGGRFQTCAPVIVGTYLFDATIESGFPPFFPSGLEVQGLMTLHDDGTVVVRHNFGPPGQSLEPALGVWKRVGRDEIKIVYLFFNVPRLDPTATTAELAVLIDRVTVILKRDRRYGILEGSLINEFFLPSQDPLDPAESPLGAVTATVENARRMLL